MSSNQNIMEKKYVFPDCDEKVICKARRNEHNYRQVYEYDKKIKREIANNNERRRMQSINIGFETLKQLLPVTMDVERLSKASILQFTAKYIQSLLSRLTALEKEIALYKSTMLNNKEKLLSPKSMSVMQEQNRKRRLNSCAADFETVQNKNIDSNLDVTVKDNFPVLNDESSISSCQGTEKIPGSLEHLVAAIEQVEGEKFYVSHTKNNVQSQILKDEVKNKSCLLTESYLDSLKLVKQNRTLSKPNLLPSNCTGKKQLVDIDNNNNSVMKPTISPYTEKLILAVSQHPDMFESNISSCTVNISRQPIYQIISNNQLAHSNGSINKTHSVSSKSDCTGGGSKRLPIAHKYLHRPPDFGMHKSRTL